MTRERIPEALVETIGLRVDERIDERPGSQVVEIDDGKLGMKPGGNVPDVTVQLSGELPPVAVNVKPYGVPCTPAGGACRGVITSGEASIWRLTDRVPVSTGLDESATLTVNA